MLYLLAQRLLYELLRKLDAELKHEVCHWAAYYVSALSVLFFISASGINIVMCLLEDFISAIFIFHNLLA